MPIAARQEEALRSALGRLPLAVFVVDDHHHLRPLNQKATALMEMEGLAGDLFQARPGHPLSRMVASILGATPVPIPARQLIIFPSGRSYVVEPSSRSEKGRERWLILLIDGSVPPSVMDLEQKFERWSLTQREHETAHLMIRGRSSREMCEEMKISPTTLKTHVKRILEKSGSRTRTEFLAGLIAPDSK